MRSGVCVLASVQTLSPEPTPQVLAEMIIFNESRVGGSRVTAAYSKPRAFEMTLSLRYQVTVQYRPLYSVTEATRY